jgi:hypothetical protein
VSSGRTLAENISCELPALLVGPERLNLKQMMAKPLDLEKFHCEVRAWLCWILAWHTVRPLAVTPNLFILVVGGDLGWKFSATCMSFSGMANGNLHSSNTEPSITNIN